MTEIVLKRTKKKPTRSFSLDSLKVYEKYLYTDTGEVGHWNVAFRIAIEKGQAAPREIIIKVERQEGRS